jgi:hypothetical protein
MNSTMAFLPTIAVAAALSTAAVMTLRKPLHALLLAICPADTTAEFWTRGAVALFYLVPLWTTLLFGVRYTSERADPIGVARDALVWGSFALIVMLVALGLRLARFANQAPARNA